MPLRFQVYHPNIDPRTGLVCLDFLTDSKHWWTPAWTVDKILLAIVSLLHEPVMDGRAINPDAANLYRRKRPRYVEIARAKTREHATASASEKERPQSRGVSLCRRLMTRVAFLQTSG
jgi:ubiquitin-conjugating enzyme E2 D/E